MMRIAVAGGGGLGYLLASELADAENAYNVVVLSRTERPEYGPLDVQVHVVDYYNTGSLLFALQGIDLVISTISGNEQINLIDAAGNSGVRLFVPSEFEGALQNRPSRNDPLDRGTSQAVTRLQHWSRQSSMTYTIFSCGVFMERFSPCGLGGLGIGGGTGIVNPGDYLVDTTNATAEYVERNSRGRTVRICLTSVYDVARFVVAAVVLGPGTWPREFTMLGDRLSVTDLIGTCSRVMNVPFSHVRHEVGALDGLIHYYSGAGDAERMAYYQRLQATANGRYDFGSEGSLNQRLGRRAFQPLNFRDWLFGMLASP